jgi:hypothetical protein
MYTYRRFGRISSHIKDYLIELKSRLSVDIYCSYQTNAVYAGFQVSHKSLEMFIELEVPLGVSMEI